MDLRTSWASLLKSNWRSTASGSAEAPVASSATASSLNLAKNLVGSGILSLPAGVAAFSSSPAALGPSLAVLFAAGFLCAYTFHLIGQVCEETNSSTFGGAWEGSVKKGKWVPQIVCILECLGGSIVYAMVLGDAFSSLLQGLGFLPAFLCTRNATIIAIAVAVLFPLCCLRSFSQLAKFSLLGTIATSYVVAFVTKRFFDGSYAAGGIFHRMPHAAAAAAHGGSMFNPQMLILVSILSTAFLVHFNAPQFYAELEPAQPDLEGKEKEDKLRRFSRVGLVGFGIAAIQYAFVMCFGFLTFGQATQGNVLLNYSSADRLAVAAKVAVGLSTIFGYPMQFAGFRDGVLEVFGKSRLPDGMHHLVTAGLLAIAVGIACSFKDLGVIQAIEGALLASFLIYAAPPMMKLRLLSPKSPGRLRLRSMIVLGALMGGIGCAVTFGWL
eukprot:TRINITY_DN19508_c0_g1_i3.p1 TRINITY_DN19508_c0_g1~~TRINITY_DN19508_c0_g1_i3.p1  ORF type:complete len:440 (-),score=89.71 TRINITY_DN19508_c0_g1_i3:94-1413(-)